MGQNVVRTVAVRILDSLPAACSDACPPHLGEALGAGQGVRAAAAVSA